MKVSDAVWELLEVASVDVSERHIIWEDGQAQQGSFLFPLSATPAQALPRDIRRVAGSAAPRENPSPRRVAPVADTAAPN